MPTDLPTLIGALTLVVGVPLNVYVVRKLRRLVRETPWNGVIRERAITAVVILLVIGVFGPVFVNNDRPIPFVDPFVGRVVTRLVIAVLAIVPASYWIWLYRKR
jgi:uncharacterized protein YneF (UPF0154 family)